MLSIVAAIKPATCKYAVYWHLFSIWAAARVRLRQLINCMHHLLIASTTQTLHRPGFLLKTWFIGKGRGVDFIHVSGHAGNGKWQDSYMHPDCMLLQSKVDSLFTALAGWWSWAIGNFMLWMSSYDSYLNASTPGCSYNITKWASALLCWFCLPQKLQKRSLKMASVMISKHFLWTPEDPSRITCTGCGMKYVGVARWFWSAEVMRLVSE